MSEPVYKVVTTLPVSAESLADGESISSSMDQAFGRRSHPWEFADRNPFPHIDPVPWFTATIDRVKAVRQRIRDVWSAARHGLPDDDDWD